MSRHTFYLFTNQLVSDLWYPKCNLLFPHIPWHSFLHLLSIKAGQVDPRCKLRHPDIHNCQWEIHFSSAINPPSPCTLSPTSSPLPGRGATDRLPVGGTREGGWEQWAAGRTAGEGSPSLRCPLLLPPSPPLPTQCLFSGRNPTLGYGGWPPIQHRQNEHSAKTLVFRSEL